MSDFSDRPFAAGSVTGVRSFDVDSLGRLRGVTHADVFKPGENVGECKAHNLTRPMFTANGVVTWRSFTHVEASEAFREKEVKPESPKHRVGSQDCACGYYAYFDGSNDYSDSHRVTALVEGYGVVTVGDRGFRAEKARLLALVDPTMKAATTEEGKHSQKWCSFSDWCESWFPVSFFVALVGAFFGVLGAIGTVVDAVEGSYLSSGLSLAIAIVSGSLAVMFGRGFLHGMHRETPNISKDKLQKCPDSPWVRRVTERDLNRARKALTLVRRNYPDVPTYPSLKAARAAHPLTEIPKPSPTDDDFWTRNA